MVYKLIRLATNKHKVHCMILLFDKFQKHSEFYWEAVLKESLLPTKSAQESAVWVCRIWIAWSWENNALFPGVGWGSIFLRLLFLLEPHTMAFSALKPANSGLNDLYYESEILTTWIFCIIFTVELYWTLSRRDIDSPECCSIEIKYEDLCFLFIIFWRNNFNFH